MVLGAWSNCSSSCGKIYPVATREGADAMPHCADPGYAPDAGASNKINTARCPLENSHPGRVLPVVPYIHPMNLGEISIKYIS